MSENNELPLYTGTQSMSYFSKKALSNSLMGVYEDDFKSFVDYWVYNNPLPQLDTESLSLGSVIDTILTNESEFSEKFFIYDDVAPTGQMLQLCKEMFKLYLDPLPYSEIVEVIEKAYEIVGFKRDKLEKIKERFEIEGKHYYECLKSSVGKKVVTTKMYETAKRIVKELKHNPYTKLVINLSTNESKTIEVINQLEIDAEWIDEETGIIIPLKGALDKVIIDHKNKKIIPIDIKTSSDSFNFTNSVYKYKYYRQGAFYKFLLEKWIKDKGLEDYTISNFLFLVCSTTSYDNHLFYKLTDNDIQVARYGGKFRNNMDIKGFEQILKEIVYMTKVGNWKYPYEVQICNGIVDLNMFQEYEQL